jgi:hypothetical protein
LRSEAASAVVQSELKYLEKEEDNESLCTLSTKESVKSIHECMVLWPGNEVNRKTDTFLHSQQECISPHVLNEESYLSSTRTKVQQSISTKGRSFSVDDFSGDFISVGNLPRL